MPATIHFDCPNCGHEIRVALEHAGRSGKCHGCGSRVTVPSPPARGIDLDDAATGPGAAAATAAPSNDLRVVKNVALMIGGGLAGWLAVTFIAVGLGAYVDLWMYLVVALLCGWLFKIVASQ